MEKDKEILDKEQVREDLKLMVKQLSEMAEIIKRMYNRIKEIDDLTK